MFRTHTHTHTHTHTPEKDCKFYASLGHIIGTCLKTFFCKKQFTSVVYMKKSILYTITDNLMWIEVSNGNFLNTFILSVWEISSLKSLQENSLFVCFEIGFCYIVQAGLKPMKLLLVYPECWDYSSLPHPRPSPKTILKIYLSIIYLSNLSIYLSI
jgi:hypothetical protein